MSNLVKYEPLDPTALDSDFAAYDGRADYLKPKQGLTVVRVLPPPSGAGWKALVPAKKHYYRPPGAERSQSFFCPRMSKAKCPLCDQADELRETGDKTDQDAARELSAGTRVLMNAIDRSAPEVGPQIWEAPKRIGDALRDILRAKGDSEGEFSEGLTGDFTHPGDGFDLGVRKSGEGLKTEWKVTAAKRRTPLSQDATQIEEWISRQKDLSRLIRPATTAEVVAMMGGVVNRRERTPAAGGFSGPRAEDMIDAEFTEEEPF
jgi:hypothetical protein